MWWNNFYCKKTVVVTPEPKPEPGKDSSVGFIGGGGIEPFTLEDLPKIPETKIDLSLPTIDLDITLDDDINLDTSYEDEI